MKDARDHGNRMRQAVALRATTQRKAVTVRHERCWLEQVGPRCAPDIRIAVLRNVVLQLCWARVVCVGGRGVRARMA
eukprot:459070-Pleurochrysis_carterae.AAC.3